MVHLTLVTLNLFCKDLKMLWHSSWSCQPFWMMSSGPSWTWTLSYYSDLTQSQSFQPMAAQLSKKAALQLAKIPATVSCRSSKIWPKWHYSKLLTRSCLALCLMFVPESPIDNNSAFPSIGSGSGLVLTGRQAITWTNYDPVYRY